MKNTSLEATPAEANEMTEAEDEEASDLLAENNKFLKIRKHRQRRMVKTT